MEQEIIDVPNEKLIRKNDTQLNAHSPVYMILFYLVAIITLCSMVFHYISLRYLFTDDFNVTLETIANVNYAIPYENLILAMIIYCLGTFGIEGTRSIILSFDLSQVKEHAKNMPRYKRNRLIQMLFSFIILTLLAMYFQMKCIQHKVTNADFHLNYLTAGIGIFMALLAYADFAPKLGKSIGDLMSHAKNISKETEEKVEEEDIKAKEKSETTRSRSKAKTKKDE